MLETSKAYEKIDNIVGEIKAKIEENAERIACGELIVNERMIKAAQIAWRQVFNSDVNRYVVTHQLFGFDSTKEFVERPEVVVTVLKFLNPQSLNGTWTYDADALSFLRQYEVLIAKEQGQMELPQPRNPFPEIENYVE